MYFIILLCVICMEDNFKKELCEIYDSLKKSLWDGISIKTIKLDKPVMGLSQKIFIATVNDDKKFVIKYPIDKNISRNIQMEINKINEGISPKILEITDDFYVEEFIDGFHYKVNDMQNINVIDTIINKLNELHSTEIPNLRTSLDNLRVFYTIIKKSFTPDVIENISNLNKEKKQEIYSIIFDTLNNIDVYFAQSIDIFESHTELCTSHNDVHYENIIKVDNDLKLIDFEFCSINHPEYDFINLYEETLIASKEQVNSVDILKHVNENNVYRLTLYNNIFWIFWTLVKLIMTPDKGYLQYLMMRLDRLNSLNNL